MIKWRNSGIIISFKHFIFFFNFHIIVYCKAPLNSRKWHYRKILITVFIIIIIIIVIIIIIIIIVIIVIIIVIIIVFIAANWSQFKLSPKK